MKRTLQSLACAKLRPLTKHPKGKEINDDDTFTANTGFHHDKYRVKINQVQLKETKEENKETHERVAADRAFETQAAIVRIMKSRKLITHAELVAEVIKATKSRGQLNVADIKKNIDRSVYTNLTLYQPRTDKPCIDSLRRTTWSAKRITATAISHKQSSIRPCETAGCVQFITEMLFPYQRAHFAGIELRA